MGSVYLDSVLHVLQLALTRAVHGATTEKSEARQLWGCIALHVLQWARDRGVVERSGCRR